MSVAAVGVVAGIAVASWTERLPLGTDSAVYRAGAVQVLNGLPLYGPHDATHLPFVYPPLAAIAFLPLAALPVQFAWCVMGILSALALGVVVRTTIGHLRPDWAARERVIDGLVLFAVALQPVWETIAFGQVNLVIMAFVVIDLLALRGSRACGLLTGAAAAIKLTPLLFLVHLVATGRRADAVRVLATFVLLQLWGAALLPSDSERYWSSAILAWERPWASLATNQSLNGMLERVTVAWPYTPYVSLALAIPCVGAAILLARQFDRAGQPLPAIVSTAMIGLLISPISWPHHWVWVAPLCLLLLERVASAEPRSVTRWAALELIGIIVVFSGAALATVPTGQDREFAWSLGETLRGNSYLLGTLLIGAAAIWTLRTSYGRLVTNREAGKRP